MHINSCRYVCWTHLSHIAILSTPSLQKLFALYTVPLLTVKNVIQTQKWQVSNYHDLFFHRKLDVLDFWIIVEFQIIICLLIKELFSGLYINCNFVLYWTMLHMRSTISHVSIHKIWLTIWKLQYHKKFECVLSASWSWTTLLIH